LIETLGEEAFELHSRYEEWRDIPVPDCFIWIFDIFTDLHFCSHDFISYPDIAAWERVYGTRLAVYEVRLIRRMSVWAADENKKAYEEKN
jgi:hypothetical protein